MNLQENLVSIILPCYNSARFIEKTVESVLVQTYPQWELLVIDDCSTDETVRIVESYVRKDSRIHLFCTEQNSGSAALPRNIGIRYAGGRYIAFLDSDDIWLPEKLAQQIENFKEDRVALVFSDYEKIQETGKRTGRLIKAPLLFEYRDLLKGNGIGCLTAVYDTVKCGKMYFREIGHEDYALWLEILKKGYVAKNTGHCVALYRLGKTSLSANKWRAVSWTWNIYRKQERLGYVESVYYFMHYLVKAILKYFR